MIDYRIEDSGDFLRLSKALKHAGRTGLRQELTKGLRRAAKPLIKETRAEARRILPSRGGLAAKVAKAPQRVQVRTGQRTAGVRVVVARRAGDAAQSTNKGYVRHPVFGERDVFVEQPVPPGWFDRPLQQSAPRVRRELARTLEDIADQVIRDARR